MSYEKSAGAIIYCIKQEEGKRPVPYFLLLRYPGGYWEFARGHMEEGEREHATAKREIQEETGLTGLQFLSGFREQYRFHFKRSGKAITKDAVLYLAQAPRWRVRVSEEHFGFAWMPYSDALAHLHFENSKDVLQKAHVFLQRRRKSDKEKQPQNGSPKRNAAAHGDGSTKRS